MHHFEDHGGGNGIVGVKEHDVVTASGFEASVAGAGGTAVGLINKFYAFILLFEFL